MDVIFGFNLDTSFIYLNCDIAMYNSHPIPPLITSIYIPYEISPDKDLYHEKLAIEFHMLTSTSSMNLNFIHVPTPFAMIRKGTRCNAMSVSIGAMNMSREKQFYCKGSCQEKLCIYQLILIV